MKRSVPAGELVERVERARIEASATLDPRRRASRGQFFTPMACARFMASRFASFEGDVRLLEAGAGVGSLVAAAVVESCARAAPPTRIDVTAFEVDPALIPRLQATLRHAGRHARQAGAAWRACTRVEDFVLAATRGRGDVEEGARRRSSAAGPGRPFTHVILNPPYRKLSASSRASKALSLAAVPSSNLYAAFVALGVRLLGAGGELVAITPRSFCNGPYFRAFRAFLLQTCALRSIHVYDARDAAFGDDSVLQENVVLHLAKGTRQGRVRLSTSRAPGAPLSSSRSVPLAEVVRPGDAEQVFHLVSERGGRAVAEAMASLPATLADLGVSVSTGKVVAFRVARHLRRRPSAGSLPLVHPAHVTGGLVRWPRAGKKPNSIVSCTSTRSLLLPRGTYVVVKRFSSKEERRRVVPALCDPTMVPGMEIGFENHLNVLHAGGRGLDPALARGLVAYLATPLVDEYVRQFSGHTQINATDLRRLRFPSRADLLRRVR